MLSCASSCPLTTRLVNVPFSPVAVLNTLLPLLMPFTTATKLPLTPLYALSTVLVSIVPLVYRLAVVVFRLAPALRGFVALLSVKPCANFGLVPCALSLSVMLLALKLAGAEGTAFSVNVMPVSVSVCADMSGVPFAVNASV